MEKKVNETTALFMAMLDTALELDEENTPFIASMFYLVCGSDMHKYQCVIGAACNAGVITCTGELIKITPKGKEMATRLREARKVYESEKAAKEKENAPA